MAQRAEGNPTVTRTAPALSPVPDGGLYLGGGGGYASAGNAHDGGNGAQVGYTMGSLVIDRHLFWRIGAWLSGEWNDQFREADADFAIRLCFGARIDLYRSPSRKVRVIANLAFAHMHEAPTSTWIAHPLESALGSSDFGLHHRFGAELGGGLLLTPWIDSRNWMARRTRVLVRASAQWMPDDHGRQWYLSMLTSVGVGL
ncbi:MAG: hypothetical protein EXR72_09775 [Myxococcales bacterium]|nr:hypothetical protein [Myxococcales bacterium]